MALENSAAFCEGLVFYCLKSWAFGSLAMAAGSSIFLGMVETPLVIRAYLRSMTSADFFAVMTLGMSTIAGSVLVLYSTVLEGVVSAPIGTIIGASFMNIVGALYISRIFAPDETTGVAVDGFRHFSPI